jgi:hypothetical protein
MPVASFVSMRLFDMRGRLVQTLLNCGQEAGEHSITMPLGLPQGRYILSYKAGTCGLDKAILIMK